MDASMNASLATTQPLSSKSAMNNLSRKEYRNAREVLIGGIAIFWILPIILESFLLAINQDRESFPFAWALVAMVGWLYAVVIGAHTVCRDWGKPEEHFLLALPVSARQVVWAKLKAGAAVLLLVLSVAAAWDVLMGHWGVFERNWDVPTTITTVRWALAWLWIFVVGYLIGFTAAIVTRQMLASTLIGCLTLIVWFVAPLISSRLRFLYPNWWSILVSAKSPTDHSWLGFGWPFVALTALGLIACIGTALTYCTRERVIRLGHKQLAWTVALVMLTLLGLAIGEVGNSLAVRDQKEILKLEGPRYLVPASMISQGNQFYAASATPIYTTPKHGYVSTTWRLQLASFRLDESGQIKDLRHADLPDKLSNSGRIIGFAMDESAELVLTLSRISPGKDPHSDWNTSLLRLRMVWSSNGPPQVVSRTIVELPPDRPRISSVNRGWNDWEKTVSRYAYLQEWGSGDRHEILPKGHKLYVFDWSDGPNPQPRYEIQLPPNLYATIYGGNLWIKSDENNSWALSKPLDPDRPELLLDKRNWAPDPDSDARAQNELARDGRDVAGVDKRGDLWCVSDLLSLRVLRHPRPHEWELVGEYRASPLALWFRRYGNQQPKFLDKSLVLENGLSEIALYDISEPARPRRVGFFQTYVGWVYPTPQFLLVVEGNLLTVLDRPGS
jgi:hypothetical protein